MSVYCHGRAYIRMRTALTTPQLDIVELRETCKSSALSPLPSSLVKDCIDILITLMISRINLSLCLGSFLLHFVGPG